jgi:transposase
MIQPMGPTVRGRRSKPLLQKYEIFLQLVPQEVTMMEADYAWQVDRSTIMRIRTAAKEGA